MADASRSSRFPVGATAGAVFILATAALVLLLRGGGSETELGDYEPGELEARVAEELDPVQPRPTRELRVTARRVEWRDGVGEPFLETPRATVSVRMGAGPGGGILISDGVVVRPQVRLVQTSEEQWNYDRPLAPLLEEEGREAGDGEATTVFLRDIVVDSGYVLLDLLDARYVVRSLDGRLARAQLSGPGLDAPTFELARVEADLVLPDTGTGEVIRSVTVADARLRILDGAVAFEVDTGTFGGSRLADAQGVWDPARGGLGLDMEMTAVEARIADLPWLPGEVPEGASGSFRLRLEPRSEGRTAVTLTELDVSAPGSSARGSVRAVIGGVRPALERVDVTLDPLSLDLVEAFAGPLPYGGTVSGTVEGTGGDIRFDLSGRLTTPSVADPFAADLSGRVALTDEGVQVRGAEVTLDQVPLAALDAVAPGLPFRGPISGTVQLQGPPGAGPLDLDLRLEAGGGVVTLAGTADVSGAVAIYDLTGRLVGVELRSVLAPAAPPAAVHAEFSVQGRGTDPATANATLRARGTFTGWESEPGDTLLVQATVADGAVDVEALRVELGPAQVAAEGRWDFVDGGGSLRYDVAVSELAPLGPYLPLDPTGQRRFARGRLELEGTATGTLDAPVVSGEVTADDFRWGEWAADRLTGDYSLDLAGDLPRVEADLSGDELRTPAADFDAAELVIDFGRPTFEVAFRADQEGGGGIVEVEAGGRIDEEGRREVLLRVLEIDLQEQRWRLPTPAEIAWTEGETVRIQDLELVQTEGDGRLRLSGTAAPMDQLDLSLDVRRLPVGDVLELAGSAISLTGELSVEGRVRGPAAAPDLDVQLSLTDGSFRGVAIRELETEVRYEGGALVLDGAGELGDSARIALDGTVPARLQLEGSPLFALVDDARIDLRVVTRTFPLSTLSPGIATMEDVEGRVQADLRVGGTPASPQLSGSAQIRDGALTIPLLNRRFRSIRGTVALEGREARLRQLVVESGGSARVEGTLSFQELTNPALDLAAELDGLEVQGVEDEDAAGLSGTVRLGGTLQQPVVTGSIHADDGALSLAPFQQPELSTRLAGTAELGLGQPAQFDLGETQQAGGLRIDGLTLEAGDDLWFVTEEARARLSGVLTVNKSGAATTIQGTLQGEGGSFELAAGPLNRRFQIVSAEIRFFGSPEPNPRLDIVASRAVRIQDGADVDVEVHVGGTLDNPSLSLATATGAEIPESELLSFLLFGRPTSDLGQVAAGGGVQGVLGQGLAYTGLAEVLFSEINQELGFLDYFQVDYLPAGGFYATAGVRLGSNLFLSADLPVSAETDVSAVGLEWRQRWGTVRAAWEPVERLDRLVGARALSFIESEVNRQWLVAWRKRWTY